MKKIFSFCAMICASAVMIMSCDPTTKPDQNDPSDDPAVDSTKTVIVLENGGQVFVEYLGGDIELPYTIKNPVEGGELIVSVPEGNTWITAKVEDAKILFTVAKNEDGEVRNEMVPFLYKFGEDSVKAYANIIQEASPFVGELVAVEGDLTYYGNLYSYDPSMLDYAVGLYTEDDIYIALDLFTSVKEEGYALPEGKYISCESGQEYGFALSVGDYSYFYKINAAGDNYEWYVMVGMGSEVVVTRKDNITTIEGVLVDAATGDMYTLSFSGELPVYDQSKGSSLTEDLNKTYDAKEYGLFASATFYGLPTPSATVNYWRIEVNPEVQEAGKPIAFIEMLTPLDIAPTAPDSINFEGVYEVDPDVYNNILVNTALPGSVGFYGTWIVEITRLEGKEIYVTGAPLATGTVTIERNADSTYNFILKGVDDDTIVPHNIDVTISNVPLDNVLDATQQAMPASVQTMPIANKRKEARRSF